MSLPAEVTTVVVLLADTTLADVTSAHGTPLSLSVLVVQLR